jgi:post-segregation antitoxin (ccd killing protein)
MQVYLPDDMYEQVKTLGLPASELLQKAVRAEVRRRELQAEADNYVAGLIAEAGEPTPEQVAEADAFVDRILGHDARLAS